MPLPAAGLLLLSLAATATPDAPPKHEPAPGLTSTMTFSVDAEKTHWVHLFNRTFDAYDTVYFEGDPKAHSIIVQTTLKKDVPLQTDSPAKRHLTAQASLADGGVPGRTLWTVEADADTGVIGAYLFEVTAEGFMDTFPTYSYYRLTDRKKLAVSNTPVLTVDTAEAGSMRHLMFQEQFGDGELSTAQVAKRLRGILTVTDNLAVVERIGVFSAPDEDKPDQPFAFLKHGAERSDDPS